MEKATQAANRDRPGRGFRSLMVEPFKQFQMGLYVLALSGAFAGICVYLFVQAYTAQYQHIFSIFNVLDPKMKEDVISNQILQANTLKIGAAFAIFLVVLFVVVFRMTHRYYGPLVSINRFVESMKNGEYDRRCKIRTKDELQDLVGKLNEMAAELEKRHGQARKDDSPRRAV